MLISHRKRFIYMKTRKTAGSSIIVYLERYCMPPGEDAPPLSKDRPTIETAAGIIAYHEPARDLHHPWWNHMPAAVVKRRLGTIWDTYTKICCIRNPFDKVFSFFWYSNPAVGEDATLAMSDKRRLFQSWLQNDTDLAVDRYMYTIEDGPPCLDFYIRYETLQFSLQQLCLMIDIPFGPEKLSWRKGQFRPRNLPYQDFYDERTADRVRTAYDREFEWFGYSPDHLASTAGSPAALAARTSAHDL